MIIETRKKLERFFRVDAEYIARGGFWLVAAKASGLGVAFLLSLLYARFVPKTVFGNYKYILSLFGTFAFFALPGVGISITRSAAKGYDGSFRKGFWMIFKSSWVITVAGVIAACYFSLFLGRNDMALLVGISAFLIPLMEGTGSWKGYFDGKRQFQTKAFWSITQDVFVFLCVATSVFIMHVKQVPTIPATLLIVASVIGGQGLINILSVRSLFKKISPQAPEDPAAIPYGLHLTAATIPSAIANYIDGILMYTYLGPIQLAIYSFALVPANQIKELLNMLGSLAFPKFAASDENAIRQELPRKLLRASILTSTVVGLYVIFAPLFYKILFPLYVESTIYSQVFALSLLFSPIALLGTAIDASGSTKRMYTYRIVSPFIQICGLIILIPMYGIWGGIIGRMIGRIANQLLLLVLFRQKST